MTRWIPGESGVATELGLEPDTSRVFRADAVPGRRSEWPSWLPRDLRQALGRAGIEAPWSHQVAAAEAAHAGRHVALVTGTGSGKSLGYLMPILAATHPAGGMATGPTGGVLRTGELPGLVTDPFPGRSASTALYLAPTKALAHDQLRAIHALTGSVGRAATLDGDTEPGARDWVREYAAIVLTNPDLLHRSLLPAHRRWSRLLRGLRFVVVDEVHQYRGVFGAQVAAVLRRLRRLAVHHGADPVFILTGATTADPAALAGAMLGIAPEEVTVFAEDASPQPNRHLILTAAADDPDAETAALLARLTTAGRQTMAFVPSRQGAERVALQARRLAAPGVRIEAYRSGYLAQERRDLEEGLRSGAIAGVACTNALELGVDLVGLDAVVLSGFPGSRAAFWQQAGRAGRRERDALIVLVTRAQPLDQFFHDHPRALLEEAVEATVLDPGNPYILGPQLAAAAQELPLTAADVRFFGPAMTALGDQLERDHVLRRRPTGWYVAAAERVVDGIDLRAAGPAIEIVESGSGRVLGAADARSADQALHEGAVYVHQGETYLCQGLDHEIGEALVRAAQPGYTTQARQVTEIRLLSIEARRALRASPARSSLEIAYGTVEVRSRVVGYLRRDAATGTVWDETPLTMPERLLRTQAVWWSVAPTEIPEWVSAHQLSAGAHAAEHACRNVLPVFTPCDRWDIAGTSQARHPDTGRVTVALYDLTPGGAGFAERAYTVAEAWLAAVRDRLERCDCAGGCPACTLSPACSSAQPLDKPTAALLLALVATPPGPSAGPSGVPAPVHRGGDDGQAGAGGHDFTPA